MGEVEGLWVERELFCPLFKMGVGGAGLMHMEKNLVKREGTPLGKRIPVSEPVLPNLGE